MRCGINFCGLSPPSKEQSGDKRRRDPFEDSVDSVRLQRWAKTRRLDLDSALHDMMGADSDFRELQRAAITAVVQGESPLLIIMPTGGGKSLIFLLPVKAMNDGTTIVVVPLIALRQDLQRKCEGWGIHCVEWNPRRPNNEAQIVLVTPESFISDPFQSSLQRLRNSQQLVRIVVDECHELLFTTENFRPALQQMRVLVQAEVQILFLSATLPPSQEATFRALFLFRDDELHVLRTSTNRENIGYLVEHRSPSDPDVTRRIQKGVRRTLQKNSADRCLIYCHSIDEGSSIAEALRCEFYHAQADGKDLILRRYRERVSRVLVTTNALGMGIDIPDIRLVVHVGNPFSLIEYAQQSGRAGRDGASCSAVILVNAAAVPARAPGRTSFEQQALSQFLMKTSADTPCRRVTLNHYLDGPSERKGCRDHEMRCDVCRRGCTKARTALSEGVGTCQRTEDPGPRISSQPPSDPPPTVGPDPSEPRLFARQRTSQTSIRRRATDQLATEGQELEKLADHLSFWQHHCVHCISQGKSGDGHRWPTCSSMDGPRQERMREQLRRIKSTIRYEKYSCCFQCGIPQSICGNWKTTATGRFERISREPCLFSDVLVEGDNR